MHMLIILTRVVVGQATLSCAVHSSRLVTFCPRSFCGTVVEKTSFLNSFPEIMMLAENEMWGGAPTRLLHQVMSGP